MDENALPAGQQQISRDALAYAAAQPAWKRLLPALVTVVIFYFIFRRIPFSRFLTAVEQADYPAFFSLMIPNSVFYFALDTLVLAWVIRWFHAPVRYRDLLPMRAVTYVVSLMNTHLARAALAYYLMRRLAMPFFLLAGTVVFLWLVEVTHLALWATGGLIGFAGSLPAELFWIPVGFAAFWLIFLSYLQWGIGSPRNWALLRTFRQARPKHYFQVIALRAVMFFVALVFHYFAVRTFGMEIPFAKLLAFLPIVFILGSLPVTVAHLGTTQAAWIFFFNDYAPEAQLLAYSLASHLAFTLGRALLGLIFLPRAYGELFGALRGAAPLGAQAAPRS